jgi:hypothetical protein
MTRISSFGLYECPKCGQIHVKPEYGSISIYTPPDLYVQPSDTRTCQMCRWEGKFLAFKFLGSRGKINTKMPNKIELWVRRILNKPYQELDGRKLYPYLK